MELLDGMAGNLKVWRRGNNLLEIYHRISYVYWTDAA